jgi:predicted enzyme related to lactoylglutathione lyase
VSIDVPDLSDGLRFDRDAIGLQEIARPIPTYAILKCGTSEIGLIAKEAGSRPAPGSDDVRRYQRHWTPVHIDFQVENFEEALAGIEAAGGCVEQRHAIAGRPPVAFCSDPFGNGFCVLGQPS